MIKGQVVQLGRAAIIVLVGEHQYILEGSSVFCEIRRLHIDDWIEFDKLDHPRVVRKAQTKQNPPTERQVALTTSLMIGSKR